MSVNRLVNGAYALAFKVAQIDVSLLHRVLNIVALSDFARWVLPATSFLAAPTGGQNASGSRQSSLACSNAFTTRSASGWSLYGKSSASLTVSLEDATLSL